MIRSGTFAKQPAAKGRSGLQQPRRVHSLRGKKRQKLGGRGAREIAKPSRAGQGAEANGRRTRGGPTPPLPTRDSHAPLRFPRRLPGTP